MIKYFMEFTLQAADISEEVIRNSITEFGSEVEVLPLGGADFRIHICTEDPTIIFDVCSDFGRITSVKVDEQRK